MHLEACEAGFVPPLGQRVAIADYAAQLAQSAWLSEAWEEGNLVGLVAVYCNDPDRILAFVSNVSVHPDHRRRGIARHLLSEAIFHIRGRQFARIELRSDIRAPKAVALYQSMGFDSIGQDGTALTMRLDLQEEIGMTAPRDYDAEFQDTADHKYAYDFDFDVMHGYMMRAYEAFRRPGNVLELGSYKGDFTRRLLGTHDDITCVEASAMAVDVARERLGDTVTLVHALFEEAELPQRYDNVILAHVLEHLEDPVGTLRRINDEWLADGGRLFLVCPNANAPSRQIAVKMGLISHNAAITASEAEHGHRITYSLDTLERDAVAAGLNVVCRSGIFFKALANFQWDRLLKTDIISPAYLDGCYALGQQYPDLCSSIYLICERGRT